MAKKLSDDRRHEITRKHTTVELTVNVQRGMAGVSDDDTSLIAQLSSKLTFDLTSISDRLLLEAGEVADMVEDMAGKSSHKVASRHCDAIKVATDSEGSSVYLRVVITSTRQVAQSRLFRLGGSLIECIREIALAAVEASESDKPTAPALGALAIGARAALESLPGSDEPQPSDRA